MSNVVNVIEQKMAVVELNGRSVLNEISSKFDVFINPSIDGDVIMDGLALDDEENVRMLSEILGVPEDSDQIDEITSANYVMFFTN
jgi:hypothetical protein